MKPTRIFRIGVSDFVYFYFENIIIIFCESWGTLHNHNLVLEKILREFQEIRTQPTSHLLQFLLLQFMLSLLFTFFYSSFPRIQIMTMMTAKCTSAHFANFLLHIHLIAVIWHFILLYLFILSAWLPLTHPLTPLPSLSYSCCFKTTVTEVWSWRKFFAFYDVN